MICNKGCNKNIWWLVYIKLLGILKYIIDIFSNLFGYVMVIKLM